VSHGSQPTARPPRILIVDDDQDNRELLKIILACEGFVTLTANSGEEALALAAQELPDLLLLDLMMPGLDGCEVTAQLKRAVLTQNIAVVIVSAMSDRATQLRTFRAGAQDFITKPVDRVDLCRRVKRIIGLRPIALTGS
jgi:CheY-like chemotaxis protein